MISRMRVIWANSMIVLTNVVNIVMMVSVSLNRCVVLSMMNSVNYREVIDVCRTVFLFSY